LPNDVITRGVTLSRLHQWSHCSAGTSDSISFQSFEYRILLLFAYAVCLLCARYVFLFTFAIFPYCTRSVPLVCSSVLQYPCSHVVTPFCSIIISAIVLYMLNNIFSSRHICRVMNLVSSFSARWSAPPAHWFRLPLAGIVFFFVIATITIGIRASGYHRLGYRGHLGRRLLPPSQRLDRLRLPSFRVRDRWNAKFASVSSCLLCVVAVSLLTGMNDDDGW